tara:strand:+ start:683 stop:946 length:264 start_codon:yes stop_codon:yes gene_type:complete
MGIKVVGTGKYPNPDRAAKKGEQDNPNLKKKKKTNNKKAKTKVKISMIQKDFLRNQTLQPRFKTKEKELSDKMFEKEKPKKKRKRTR